MKCCKCGKEIDVTEANEYYFNDTVLPATNVDMYPIYEIKVICQQCL